MKKLIILAVLCSFAWTVNAQTIAKPEFRPDWVFVAPRPSNGTYLYVVEHGEGNTKREAINQALARVLQSTASRLGQTVSTDEIYKAAQAGTDYEVIAKRMNVPINKVCEFPVQDPQTNSWTMYVLCQVAKAGNVIPDFEATDVCIKHTLFDARMARWKKEQDSIAAAAKDAENAAYAAYEHEKIKSNATALVASTFIPGMGQMLKKRGGSGAAFLLSELVVFGGGTACYFLGEEQAKKMKAASTTYAEYQAAKNMKNIMDIAMYSAFGVGAVIHISNMVHAWLVEDRRLQNKTNVRASFAPALIPTNEYSTPNYAMGAGVQIKF